MIRPTTQQRKNWQQSQRAKGLCRSCTSPVSIGPLCEHHAKLDRDRTKKKAQAKKEQIIAHYGGVCAWPECGVKDLDMLSLDHVNDDGAEDRKQFGLGTRFYRYVVKQGFPDRYRVLCMNHQWKKRMTLLRGESLPQFLAFSSACLV